MKQAVVIVRICSNPVIVRIHSSPDTLQFVSGRSSTGKSEGQGGSRPSTQAQLSGDNHEPLTANPSLLLNRHKQGLKQAAQLPAIFLSLATLLPTQAHRLLHTGTQVRKAVRLEASPL